MSSKLVSNKMLKATIKTDDARGFLWTGAERLGKGIMMRPRGKLTMVGAVLVRNYVNTYVVTQRISAHYFQ